MMTFYVPVLSRYMKGLIVFSRPMIFLAYVDIIPFLKLNYDKNIKDNQKDPNLSPIGRFQFSLDYYSII